MAVISDTIGDTSADYQSWSGYVRAYRIQPSSSGSLLSIGCYVKATGSGNGRFALYADNGSGTYPSGAPLVQTSSAALVTGWCDLSATGVEINAGTYYWVANQFDTAASDIYENNGGTLCYISQGYQAFPTWSGTSTSSGTVYMRITYVNYQPISLVNPSIIAAAPSTYQPFSKSVLNLTVQVPWYYPSALRKFSLVFSSMPTIVDSASDTYEPWRKNVLDLTVQIPVYYMAYPVNIGFMDGQIYGQVRQTSYIDRQIFEMINAFLDRQVYGQIRQTSFGNIQVYEQVRQTAYGDRQVYEAINAFTNRQLYALIRLTSYLDRMIYEQIRQTSFLDQQLYEQIRQTGYTDRKVYEAIRQTLFGDRQIYEDVVIPGLLDRQIYEQVRQASFVDRQIYEKVGILQTAFLDRQLYSKLYLTKLADQLAYLTVSKLGEIPFTQSLSYFYYGNVRPPNAAIGTIFFNTTENKIDVLTMRGWVRIYG